MSVPAADPPGWGALAASLARPGTQTPSPSRPGLRRGEIAFVLAALFLFSDALIGPIFAPGQNTTDDLAWLRDLWLPIYAGTAVFGLARWRALAEAPLAWLLFAVLIAWVALSQAWSLDPAVTQRRAVALAATTLFGLYAARSFDGGGLVVLAGWCLVGLAVGSVAMALGDPALGVHHGDNAGDWRGLWYQKNALGGIMAYGVLTCVAAWRVTGRRWPWVPGALLCLGLVLMSRSKTGLLCTLVPLALLGLGWAFRRGGVYAVLGIFAAGVGGGGLAALSALDPDAMLKALGKDPTLTGRTDIWAALFRQLAHRPLTGFGYGAFWLKDSIPAKYVRAETQWLVPSAHNGWIDVLVQVGWIGAALVALTVAVVAVAAAMRGWRLDDGDWSLMVVAAFVIRSLSESVLISQNSFDWVLFVAAAATLLGRKAAHARRDTVAERPEAGLRTFVFAVPLPAIRQA